MTGWMINGPRTLEEQMLGLQPALDEAAGKSCLDLGCAEGLIGIEFAKAGAVSVRGIDYNAELIAMARALPANVTLELGDVTSLVLSPDRPQYDIVLALAILHKLPDPTAAVRYCAQTARDLIVVRLPAGSTGTFRSKNYPHGRADVPATMTQCGFVRERKEEGPRGEWVHYYRRNNC